MSPNPASPSNVSAAHREYIERRTARERAEKARRERAADEILATLQRIERALTANASPPTAVGVADAAARLGCSRTQVFALLKSRELESAPKVGRARMVLVASIDRYQSGGKSQRTNPPRRQRTAANDNADPDLAARILKLPL